MTSIKNTFTVDHYQPIRIVRFYNNTVVISGQIDYRKYSAQIDADITIGNEAYPQIVKIDFRFDLEVDDEYDICSEFKCEKFGFIYGSYPTDLLEITNQLKKCVLLMV